jgi:hypothetical protein
VPFSRKSKTFQQKETSAMSTEAVTVLQEEKALLDRLKELRRTKRPRELVEALDAGWLPQGTRLVDPKNPDEGKVFVFAPDEAAAVAIPLRAIAAAQLKK